MPEIGGRIMSRNRQAAPGLRGTPLKSADGRLQRADDEGLPLAVDRWVPIDMTETSNSSSL